MQGTMAAGWYRDPEGRAPARWWDGVWWTAWESDGSRQWLGSTPAPARRPSADDLPALAFVRTVFILEARRRGLLEAPQVDELARLTDQLAAEARGPRAAAGATATPSAPAPTHAPVQAPVPGRAPVPAPSPDPVQAPTPVHARVAAPPPARPHAPLSPPAPRAQGRLSRWWAAGRRKLDSELTVHGLTYLGVLLLFVGVFGLVAFAFGDVEPGLRPVAELAVAAVPFAAAGLLARSGARFVARAMIAVGGLILPVMVVTSTVDGFAVPPDLDGFALPVGTALACAAIAVAYAVRVRRRPDSALGVMVAPVAWFAAGMGAVALARPVPSGEDVAVPGAAQVAVIALAVMATTWWAQRSTAKGTPSALATGALAAAPAGVVVTAVLALVAWAAEGWPVVPVIVTTTALALAVSRVLASRRGEVLAGWWLAVVLRVLTIDEATPLLSEHVALPGAAVEARPALLLATLLAGAGLLELMVRRVRASAVAFAVLGWAVTLVTVLGVLEGDAAWWGVAGAVVLAAWAPVRRVSPPALAGAGAALDAIAVVAPVAVVVGVRHELGGPTAGALTALLALAVTPLARGRLRRRPGDPLWIVWWAGAVVVSLIASGALAVGGLLRSVSITERAVVPTMLALVVAALVAGPGSRVMAVALATPVVWFQWSAVIEATGWGKGTLALGFAALGLGAVVAAHLSRPAPARGRAAVALAVAGFVTSGVAALSSPGASFLAAALGLGTFAWLVTALLGDRGLSPVGAALDRSGTWRSLPWVLTLVGLPTTVTVALHASGAVRVGAPWWALPLVVTALASGAATRARTPERLRPALPWCAFAFAVLAVLATLAEPAPTPGRGSWSTVAALAALVLVAPAVRGRPLVLTWTAWLTLAPLVGVAVWTGAGPRALGGDVIAIGALVGVGGLLAVGALLVDRASPREPRALPRRPVTVPPFLSGVGQLALGTVGAATLGLAAARTSPSGALLVAVEPADTVVFGALVLAAAALAGAVAGLSGVGVTGAAAALVAWVGLRVVLAASWGAWADVGVAGLLLALALVASLVRAPAARWARWDVPLSVASVPPALAALAVAGVAQRPAVFVAVGALAIGAAVRLVRQRATSESLATLGSVLVLLGAAWSSRGAAVVALAGLAVAHTSLAARWESGAWRTARQWVGAILAASAWLVFVAGPTALGGSDQSRVDVTAVGAALVTVVVIAAAAAGRLDRSWCAPWGGVGALLAVGAVLAPAIGNGLTPRAANGLQVAASWSQVAAWVLLAIATVLVAQLAGESTVGELGARRRGWRVTADAPVLGALLTALTTASATSLAWVTVLTAVSLVTAVVTVVVARAGRRGLELPLVVLGVATLALAALAAGGAIGPRGPDVPSPALLAVVLAVAAAQAAAYGVALRVLGLRLAAPVLAWLAWVVYAADALDGVVLWYTIPVGLAMIAVVGVWRADLRARGLAATGPAIAALDLAGIAFLVVASFVAAFTASVWHALVAAGIGVLVFFWAVLTRVRHRLVAGAAIVLAGVVVAAVLPLVALVPAWGGAALWVAVAVVGLLVVLAATLLERGRAALVGGRARLRAATEGWE